MKTITTHKLNIALAKLAEAEMAEQNEKARCQRAREKQVHLANRFSIAPGPPLTALREEKGTSK
jgi:hypothetical protein